MSSFKLLKFETEVKKKKGSVLSEGLKPKPERPKRGEGPEDYRTDTAYQKGLEAHPKKVKTWKKAQGKMQDMIKGLDLTHAQALLTDLERSPRRV